MHVLFQTNQKGLCVLLSCVWSGLILSVSESVKHRKHRHTLWVPGQVVGDGIEEELSCLLPLIVKLLFVTEERNTPCNVIGKLV